MRRALLLGTGLLVGGFHVQGLSAQTPPEIHTSGSATRTITSNLVTLTVEFSVRRLTPGDAGRANAQRAVAIRRALVALGIPSDSIITAGYHAQMTVNAYGRDTGFVATNTVVARIRDLRLIGPAIDTSLAEGATRVADVRYRSSGADESFGEALNEATQVARTRAETMAKAAGGRLGRLIELTTQDRAWRGEWFDPRDYSMVGTGLEAPGTPIQARSLQVSATVFGRWEFIPD